MLLGLMLGSACGQLKRVLDGGNPTWCPSGPPTKKEKAAGTPEQSLGLDVCVLSPVVRLQLPPGAKLWLCSNLFWKDLCTVSEDAWFNSRQRLRTQ